mmetsp:Transcript_30864/g.27299  ORF Transcript_30864/g.27299 Transcript_30864/m.27299 type:complete len:225 (+) Transcript_30864:182-856(+)
MNLHEMNYYSQINFTIIISLLLFALDPDLIDQGELFKMKKEFVKFGDELEDPKTMYKVNYTLICIFGQVVMIQEGMGVQPDYKLPLKYGSALENDKLSYVVFFSSLESLQDPMIKPQIEKALEYCDELKIEKLHRLRINLELTIISLGFQDPTGMGIHLVKESIYSLIDKFSNSDSQLIEQKLLILYTFSLALPECTADPLLYAKVAQKYLKLAVKYYENIDNV